MTDPENDLVPVGEFVEGEVVENSAAASGRPVVFPPDGWRELHTLDTVMCNLRSTPQRLGIDYKIAELLQQDHLVAAHTAWDFFGKVWFDDGRWHEMVMVYKKPVATYTADSLPDLMKQVNDAHGWR